MTWNIIRSSDLKGIGIVGKQIARNPDAEEHYEVKSIDVNGYVTAIHNNEKVSVKVFPEERLIKENWWVRH